MDFRELVTRDAQSALDAELNNLLFLSSSDSLEATTIQNDFKGFSKLFAKFLAPASSVDVDWDKIKKPPTESVSSYKHVHNCYMPCLTAYGRTVISLVHPVPDCCLFVPGRALKGRHQRHAGQAGCDQAKWGSGHFHGMQRTKVYHPS